MIDADRMFEIYCQTCGKLSGEASTQGFVFGSRFYDRDTGKWLCEDCRGKQPAASSPDPSTILGSG